MVTGIETTGIVLAILPLVVNQLDAYVQGIETLKGFKTKRYRRLLEDYATRLGTQRAIFLDTLEHSLEGLVDDQDDIKELIDNPRGQLWKDTAFQKKFAKKLDRNYHPFTRTMTELSTTLENLAQRLGLGSGDSLKTPWDDASAVEREMKKFKDIFSKSVYADLLSRVESANSALKFLIEGSDRHHESRRKKRLSKDLASKYKIARKHASNLYNAVVRDTYWKCSCKDLHRVHLRIEPEPFEAEDDQDYTAVLPKLRIAFSSQLAAQAQGLPWQWEEVETVPVMDVAVAPPPLPAEACTTTALHSSFHRKVQFAIVSTTLGSLPWPKVPDVPPARQISCLCSALRLKGRKDCKEYIGSLVDEADKTHRYCFFLLEELDHDMKTESLEDLLNSSLQPIGLQNARAAFRFSRRDRLFFGSNSCLKRPSIPRKLAEISMGESRYSVSQDSRR
ncbi:hypothetical protein CLAIMM_05590 [Cladophialophora immunda]|nr:hypothetical protein CLAIMM_05590 [Cladophialophora immunda]